MEGEWVVAGAHHASRGRRAGLSPCPERSATTRSSRMVHNTCDARSTLACSLTERRGARLSAGQRPPRQGRQGPAIQGQAPQARRQWRQWHPQQAAVACGAYSACSGGSCCSQHIRLLLRGRQRDALAAATATAALRRVRSRRCNLQLLQGAGQLLAGFLLAVEHHDGCCQGRAAAQLSGRSGRGRSRRRRHGNAVAGLAALPASLAGRPLG